MLKVFFLAILLSANICLSEVTESSSPVVIDNSNEIELLYERAKKYIDESNYKKSLKVLKSLTKREDLLGFRADIYNLLGFSYRKLSNPELEKSFAAYMMAIEINPKHIGAHEYLGELYLMMNNKDKAFEMLVKLETIAGTSSKEYLDLKKAIEEY
tara:strand:+ start:181 stop:648 length:468 start_codon:yes stop_codon:yes gene_type:complete